MSKDMIKRPEHYCFSKFEPKDVILYMRILDGFYLSCRRDAERFLCLDLPQ